MGKGRSAEGIEETPEKLGVSGDQIPENGITSKNSPPNANALLYWHYDSGCVAGLGDRGRREEGGGERETLELYAWG